MQSGSRCEEERAQSDIPLALAGMPARLGHFDQQGLVGLVRGFAGQAQAFGCAPLMVLEFGHGTLPLRSNAEDRRSVPCHCERGQVGACLPTLLAKIAENAYRYRVSASLRR